MKCPHCGAPSKMQYNYTAKQGHQINRSRLCRQGHLFVTYETAAAYGSEDAAQHTSDRVLMLEMALEKLAEYAQDALEEAKGSDPPS